MGTLDKVDCSVTCRLILSWREKLKALEAELAEANTAKEQFRELWLSAQDEAYAIREKEQDEIDALKAEGQKWRDKCSEDHEAACLRAADELEEKVKLQAELTEAKAERDKLRKALEKYGQHSPFCKWGLTVASQKGISMKCGCGFGTALQPPK